MTVGELIKKLKKLDKDLIICQNGYEGGYTEEVNEPYVTELYLNVNEAWYYGEHESNLYGRDESKYEKGKRVII
jgi:hypothetical protein